MVQGALGALLRLLLDQAMSLSLSLSRYIYIYIYMYPSFISLSFSHSWPLSSIPILLLFLVFFFRSCSLSKIDFFGFPAVHLLSNLPLRLLVLPGDSRGASLPGAAQASTGNSRIHSSIKFSPPPLFYYLFLPLSLSRSGFLP